MAEEVKQPRKMYSVKSAAAMLDLSERTIRQKIKDGDIKAEKWHGNVRIPESELCGTPIESIKFKK